MIRAAKFLELLLLSASDYFHQAIFNSDVYIHAIRYAGWQGHVTGQWNSTMVDTPLSSPETGDSSEMRILDNLPT